LSRALFPLASHLPQQVVRITGRIPEDISILLIGSDLDGKVFSESTSTVVLSFHGASILSRYKLSPDQELILRCPDRKSEAVIRIVNQVGSSNGAFTYGVAFVDPNLHFWNPEFPVLSPAELEAGLISLVCSSCKTIEKFDNSEIKPDLFALNKGLLRLCKRCGFSTLWKLSAGANGHEPGLTPVTQTPPAPSIPALSSYSPPPQTPVTYSRPLAAPVQTSLQAPITSQPSVYHEPRATVLTLPPPSESHTPRVERRKHVRTRVNFSACVRHPDRGDDIVVCEDMSRGGLRFKSKKQYYAQSLIEIAAPYNPGQPAIFVPAQIVSVQELPAEHLFRHGVAYLQLLNSRKSF
jgi:hypothetical protein